MIVAHAVAAGLLQSLRFFWDSLFGLIFGFLISAIVQVTLTPGAMQRYLGPNLRGIVYGAAFGIISSACSYGSTAAARGFYQRGADPRAVFSFLVSSTNMNVAILILFWSLLGWKFSFAEFFGGIVIIAVVSIGFTVLFRPGELERLQREHLSGAATNPVDECHSCGVEDATDLRGLRALGAADAWHAIAQTAWSDVLMLRSELAVGYVLAGFAAALVPPQWLAHALHAVGAAPYVGYVLLLALGLAIAVVTFVCSMGNVPVARFLANAGIPLGANTTFIYGDLLVPPLVAIYKKSFPPRIAWTFVALFIVGAMLAGALMELAIGKAFGGISMGSMAFNDRLTLVSNIVGIAAVIGVAAASKIGASPVRE